MSNPTDGALPVPPELPPELKAALQAAVAQSLGSLDSLRQTLRRHVRTQQSRGVLLGEIDAQIRKLMADATHAAGDVDGETRELAKQVAQWTRSFFSGTR